MDGSDRNARPRKREERRQASGLAQRRRDPSNYELTVKRCIDALQPMRSYVRKHSKTKKPELVIELGVGVVEGDDPRYVVRGPEMPVGLPLGTKNPVKGMVILHIYPLPPERP